MTTSDKICHLSNDNAFLNTNRKRGLAIHASISVLIAIALICSVVLFWYPSPWLDALGGMRLVVIVFGVDAVLGPLLMWLLYHPDRKTRKALWFDVGFIICLQFGALSYGLSILLAARPAYVVFAVDRFELVQAGQVVDSDSETFNFGLFSSPQYAFLNKPNQLDDNSWAALLGGRDLSSYPQYYLSYENNRDRVLAKGIAMHTLRERKVNIDDRWLNNPQLLALPLTVKDRYLTVLIDRKTGYIRHVIDFDLWDVL